MGVPLNIYLFRFLELVVITATDIHKLKKINCLKITVHEIQPGDLWTYVFVFVFPFEY